MSLLNQLEERCKLRQSSLITQQTEVQQEATKFTNQIQLLKKKITEEKAELENRTAMFREELEKERKERNELEDRKTRKGQEIGQRYYDCLLNIQEQAECKAQRMSDQLLEEHSEIQRSYHLFEGNYQRMMGDMPDRYLKEAGERVEEFNERKKRLEEGVRTLEGEIQWNFRKTAEQRIETVDYLESAISSAKLSISNQRSQLASDIDNRFLKLNALLHNAASSLGLLAQPEA